MSKKILFTVLEEQLKERITNLEQINIDELNQLSILNEQMTDIKSKVISAVNVDDGNIK